MCLMLSNRTFNRFAMLRFVESYDTLCRVINDKIIIVNIFHNLKPPTPSCIFYSFDYDSDANSEDVIRLEQDIFSPLAGTEQLYVFQTTAFWSQIKTTR